MSLAAYAVATDRAPRRQRAHLEPISARSQDVAKRVVRDEHKEKVLARAHTFGEVSQLRKLRESRAALLWVNLAISAGCMSRLPLPRKGLLGSSSA